MDDRTVFEFPGAQSDEMVHRLAIERGLEFDQITVDAVPVVFGGQRIRVHTPVCPDETEFRIVGGEHPPDARVRVRIPVERIRVDGDRVPGGRGEQRIQSDAFEQHVEHIAGSAGNREVILPPIGLEDAA